MQMHFSTVLRVFLSSLVGQKVGLRCNALTITLLACKERAEEAVKSVEHKSVMHVIQGENEYIYTFLSPPYPPLQGAATHLLYPSRSLRRKELLIVFVFAENDKKLAV